MSLPRGHGGDYANALLRQWQAAFVRPGQWGHCTACGSEIVHEPLDLIAWGETGMCHACVAWRACVKTKCAISKCLGDGEIMMVNSQRVRGLACRYHADRVTEKSGGEWRRE